MGDAFIKLPFEMDERLPIMGCGNKDCLAVIIDFVDGEIHGYLPGRILGVYQSAHNHLLTDLDQVGKGIVFVVELYKILELRALQICLRQTEERFGLGIDILYAAILDN